MLTISIILNIVLVIVLVTLYSKITVIKDKLPNVDSPKNRWMQLQNEGAKYIKTKDEIIYLRIIK